MSSVFLSSTYIDLVKYRGAVIDALRAAGHEVVCMENFGARSHKPDIVCRELLAPCDLCVVLVGRRYGTIPEGYSKSMTHLEYDAATEQCKPRLVFILDKEADWPAEHIDRGEHAQLLECFTKHLEQSHTPASFIPGPEELAQKVVKAIERWKNHDYLQNCLKVIYPRTVFTVESDLHGVVRASAERLCNEINKEDINGGPVPIGVTGGPLVRKIIKVIVRGGHKWAQCQWLALNRTGECAQYFYSANYQCTQLSEMTGGTSYVALPGGDDRYAAVLNNLHILVCSCGGRDGFLISRLLDHCKNLPKEVVGDFCFTPIDEKGQAIKFKIPAAIKYLKGIDPRPKFSTLSELRNRHCKILLPLAQTNDPNVGPVDIEKRVTAVKAVLSAGIVAHCVLSEKMAELLLPPKVRGYQLLHKVSYDQFGIVYSAMRLESSVPINVRIMDSSNPADEKAITSGIAATPSVEKEIIISDPLEPIDDVRRSGQGFPYLVMGSIKRVRLSAGVRKPGNWAATAIRISVEQLERDTKDKVRILDMGCGSGAIGLYLALSNQVQKVVFADIDHEALRCVTKNIEGLHPDIAKKCTVVEAGDLFSKLGSKHRDFDIIIFGAPFFPNLEEGIEVPDADLSGRTGNEITLRFVTDVWHYLREGGCAITYLPDYVPYDVILATAKTKKLDTEKRKFAILYPATPKCQFPPALEIQHRVKLEGWLRSTNRSTPFTDEIWSNRRFLGFEMVFFVMRKRR